MGLTTLTRRGLTKPSPGQLSSMVLMVVGYDRLRSLVKWLAVYGALALGLGGVCRYPWEIPGITLRLLYTAIVAFTEYIARGCKPLFDEWTLLFEIVRAVARCMAMHYSFRTMVPRNAKFMRLQTEVAGTIMGTLACWHHGTTTTMFRYNGLEHIWLRLKTTTSKPPTRRCVVLYFHGGGYAVLSPRFYVSSTSELLTRITSQLQKVHPDFNHVQVDLLVANYRKIPEHPYPTPTNDAYAMYRFLLDDEGVAPQDLFLVGDSAGAGLVLATMLRVRDNDPRELPCGAILSSPYVDLEMRGDERRVPYCLLADGAVNVVPKMYVPWGGCPKTWGYASPLHCKLTGLPQVYIITGEFDYLLPQSQRLMERAQEDGVSNWQLDVHRHMVHVFMHVPPFILPYASKGLDAMAMFAAKTLTEKKTSGELHVLPAASF